MRFRPVFLDKLGTSFECTHSLTYSTASMARAAQGVSGPSRQETEFRTSRCVKRGRSQFLPLISWEIGIGHSHEARDPIPRPFGGPLTQFEAALGGGLSNCPEE